MASFIALSMSAVAEGESFTVPEASNLGSTAGQMDGGTTGRTSGLLVACLIYTFCCFSSSLLAIHLLATPPSAAWRKTAKNTGQHEN